MGDVKATREADLLIFRLRERRLALPCEGVARVAQIESITPLPSDLTCNLGFVVHRGVSIGLLDLEWLLEEGGPGEGRQLQLPSLVVFARFPRGVAGFPVDQIEGVVTPEGPRAAGDAMAEPPVLVDLAALEIHR